MAGKIVYYNTESIVWNGRECEMKIVVLAGGLSAERDVSFVTGKTVSEALRSKGHQVLMVDVYMGYGKTGDCLEGIFGRGGEGCLQSARIAELAPDIETVKNMREDTADGFFGPNVIALCRMADIVFIALHGENGEDGRVQATFDLLGVRYTGSDYISSAIAMNKKISKQFFSAHAIPTPRGIAMHKSERSKDAAQWGIGFPCVVKPCCGGSSIGVSIIHTRAEYEKALDEAFRWEDQVVLEEYIKGREFSVGVVDYQALPVIEMAPLKGFYDYKNKYQAGSTIETCPAQIPPETARQMQEYAVAVAKAIGLDTYSRMDFILDSENRIYCLEANTLPGMTPTSLLPQEAQAVGMGFADLCEKLVTISMKRRRNPLARSEEVK